MKRKNHVICGVHQKPLFNLNSLCEFVYIVVFYFGHICLVCYNRSCNKLLFIWNNYLIVWLDIYHMKYLFLSKKEM